MSRVENFLIRLNGKPYRVWVDHCMCGFHSPPCDKEGLIAVGCNPECRALSKSELNTLIHETLHVREPNEKKVAELAKDLTDMLWRVGYRRKKSK